jgi:NADPH2:quinone reductase
MLAIEATEKGGPEVLKAVEKAAPTPQPGQIVVRHKAIGLNLIETYQRGGLYPVPYPVVLGGEAAGVVEAIGEGVTRFREGDRVAYTAGFGAYSEANAVPAARTARLPDGISFETGAAAFLKGMTSEFLLRRCYPIQPGETALIHAAAGGVGQIMVQWAKALGAKVIAAAGSAEKLAIAQNLGADYLVNYNTEDVAARVREITNGKGVPVAYDSVGAATFESTLASLAKRGMFVSYGNASGPPPAFAPLRLAQAGSVYITRPTLMDYNLTPEDLDASAAALFAVIESGAVKINIGRTFALNDAREAHIAMEARATTGSSLLIP